MSSAKLIDRTFRQLDRSLRNAALAQLGGILPSTEITSWFGGHFVGAVGETWPLSGGQPMIPLLQVRTSELPHVPWQIGKVVLFNVFVDATRLPTKLPTTNGEGWLIRTYESLNALAPLSGQPTSSVKPCAVQWTLAEGEGPGWKDAATVADLSKFCRIEGAADMFHDRYSRSAGTKVGGWPSYTQLDSAESADYFVFQIASEAKANWMWGDKGNAYFYFEGEWVMNWDCY